MTFHFWEEQDFLFSSHVQTSYGSHWTSSSIAVEVKQLWCEADYSPESSVEVKTKWSYTCLSLGCLRGRRRDNHTLVCYLWVSHICSLYLLGRDLNTYTFVCVCVYFFFFEKFCNLHDGFRVIIRMLMCLLTYLFLRHFFHNGFICG